MKLIGILGGIATGKSTVANLFAKRGAKIIDADSIARKIVQPQKKAWKEIVGEFGEEILNSDKTINRKRLGVLVFSHPNLREKLNRITHPLILKSIKNKIDKYKKEGESLVVIDAALLGQFGEKKPLADILIHVTANRKTQLKRLMERNRLSEKEANARISSQKYISDKWDKADYIIDTSISLEDTKKAVNKILDDILTEGQAKDS